MSKDLACQVAPSIRVNVVCPGTANTPMVEALMAPESRHVIERLHSDVVATLNQPDIRERFRQQGVDADPGTPAELAAHIKAESARFDKLIKSIGLKVE